MSTPKHDVSLAQHDHGYCIETALATAEQLCEARGLRFTTLRRRVLELVWQSHRPIGAYEILNLLGQEKENAAPPTVTTVPAPPTEEGSY